MLVVFVTLTRILLAGGPADADQVKGPASEPGTTEGEFRVTTDAEEIAVFQGDRPVLRYRYRDVPHKPYVRELFSPRGLNVLRDAPADHLHHHGLMFAVSAGDVTFWAEDEGSGRQLHTNTGVQVDDSFASFSGLLPWVIDSRVLLREHREVQVALGPAGVPVTLVTWRTTLMPEGNVTLGGAHYYGLGARFAASMDRTATFHNAAGKDGEIFRGNEWLARADWCACTAEVEGQPVTVAMFDHPDNPRHPATWFTMAKPFAYMSATLKLHEEPLRVLADKPLALRYGVALWDGRAEISQIDALYKQWIAMAKDEPEK